MPTRKRRASMAVKTRKNKAIFGDNHTLNVDSVNATDTQEHLKSSEFYQSNASGDSCVTNDSFNFEELDTQPELEFSHKQTEVLVPFKGDSNNNRVVSSDGPEKLPFSEPDNSKTELSPDPVSASKKSKRKSAVKSLEPVVEVTRYLRKRAGGKVEKLSRKLTTSNVTKRAPKGFRNMLIKSCLGIKRVLVNTKMIEDPVPENKLIKFTKSTLLPIQEEDEALELS